MFVDARGGVVRWAGDKKYLFDILLCFQPGAIPGSGDGGGGDAGGEDDGAGFGVWGHGGMGWTLHGAMSKVGERLL